MKPVVAIVGRPNVGKSTLFNRIVGRRAAITLDQPGVTRDRHYGEASWDGREFLVVDSGGFFLEEKGLHKKIRDQIEVAVQEAALILFVLDGRLGLQPEDERVGALLRRSGKKVLFVVNKIDTTRQEDLLADFYKLGGELHPVSAEDGLGVNDLLDEVVETVDKGPSTSLSSVGARSTYDHSTSRSASSSRLVSGTFLDSHPQKRIRVAIIGRPNVGKSSLLNRLLGEERVVVDPEPGTTRDSIDTELRVGSEDYLLIDTAGIRRGAKSASKVERYSVLGAVRSIERADVCLLLLDAAVGLHKQDAHVTGLIQEAGKGALLLWNKWDLVKHSRRTTGAFSSLAGEKLKFLDYSPLLFVSAKTGLGCPSIWPAVQSVYEACGRRVATRLVNEALQELTASHNPPVYKGRPVRFSYATQIKVFPPTFLVFVSEPAGVHFSFKRYLINGFRRLLGFTGAPVRVSFRKKR